jgi:hypothetical protein
MKAHPYASLFPMMSEAEFCALKADIKAHGLIEYPTVGHDGTLLLDGRNRAKACDELGIDFPTQQIGPDDDELQVVISANLHRRHLASSQRAMVAARLATLRNGQRKNSSAPSFDGAASRDDAAQLLNVSTKSLDRAKHVIEHGSKELIAAVEGRELSVSLAEKLCKQCEDKREQTKLIKQGVKVVRETVSPSTTVSSGKKGSLFETAAGKATTEQVAEVELWLEQQDERPAFERFQTLWNATDDIGRAAMRAFVLDAA